MTHQSPEGSEGASWLHAGKTGCKNQQPHFKAFPSDLSPSIIAQHQFAVLLGDTAPSIPNQGHGDTVLSLMSSTEIRAQSLPPSVKRLEKLQT